MARQLVADAEPGSEIACRFTVQGTSLDITVTGLTRSGTVPPTDTFSWTVLRALVDTVTASADGASVTLALHLARCEAREISYTAQDGITRNRLVFTAVDRIEFSAGVASAFMSLARA